MATHPYEGVPLTLVCGVGRSGTTALRESLGLHPDVDSTQRENNIIYDVLETAQRNCTVPARRHGMRVDDRAYDAAFRSLLLSLLWPVPRTPAPARLMAFSNLTLPGADYLVRLFPGVRMVYLVRNGIEVVSSRMRFESFKNLPFEQHVYVWSLAAEVARWGAERPDFLLVRHEHLIAPGGPERETARIFEFLGLPYAPQCAANLRGRRYHPTPELGGARDNPRLESRARALRRDWTPDQLRIFSGQCAAAMEYFGYECPWRGEPGAALEAKPLADRVADVA